MFDKLKDSTFVVFDCETTGLDWRRGCQIIELAGEKIKNGEVVDTFHCLINPSVSVEDGAYRVHGLSNMFLAENGKSAHEKFPEFLDFISDSILVGHNVLTFDVPFVNSELSRVGLAPMRNMIVDTLIMARKILPQLPNHKLGTVAQYFELDTDGAHRALKDVEMNRIVFLKMLDQYLQKIAAEEKKREKTLF